VAGDDTLSEKLRSIVTLSDGIMGAALVTSDGFALRSNLPADVDVEVLCAISGLVGASSAKASQELRQGAMSKTVIEFEDGKLLLEQGNEFVLMVLTKADTNLGMVRLAMRRLVVSLNEVIEELLEL